MVNYEIGRNRAIENPYLSLIMRLSLVPVRVSLVRSFKYKVPESTFKDFEDYF